MLFEEFGKTDFCKFDRKFCAIIPNLIVNMTGLVFKDKDIKLYPTIYLIIFCD